MRNGIVNMDEVQLLVDRHIHHFTGECGFIGQVFEKRVGGYANFVEKDILVEKIEPWGLGIGNKMDLVTRGSECFA